MYRSSSPFVCLPISLIMIMVLGVAVSAAGQQGSIPDAEKGTGVDEQLGDTIDPGIMFRDDRDRRVQIGDYFDGKQPVILSFNYSNCPKLCSVQLENMAISLRKTEFKANDDFQIVSVSIDPLEQVATARKSKEKYLTVYGDEKTADGWHFLTGTRDSIEVLADNCGIKYKYIPHQKLYSHPPVFLLVSPEGKIVRYIHGLDYEPVTIKRALVEAAQGKIGSAINRITYITGCYMYDDATGQYTPQMMGIMRIGGALTAILLLAGLIPYWFRGADPNGALPDADDFDHENEMKTA